MPPNDNKKGVFAVLLVNEDNMTKALLYLFYVVAVVVMAIATVVGRNHGQDYAVSHIYGAWWFTLLWALLAVVGVVWIVKRRMRRWSLLCLHGAWLLILVGAMTTHVTAESGSIHLRRGEATSRWMADDSNGGKREQTLPFEVRLDEFKVVYDAGTESAADYQSALTFIDGEKLTSGRVSMNNIFSYGGMRFYQSSYDDDMKGCSLSINADPYGIPITYTGYALLFLSMLWMLIDRRGAFRQVLRSDAIRRGVLSLALLVGVGASLEAATTLPRATAAKFGRLHILYNGRICSVETYAIDFTKKIYGKPTYNGLSALQVLTGWIFWGDEWGSEKFIHVKGGKLADRLLLPDYMSLNGFFDYATHGYVLGPYIHEYYNGNSDKLYKQAAEVDERIQLIMDLRHGSPLKIFPNTANGHTQWLAPMDKLPQGLGQGDSMYIRNAFSLLYQYALSGSYGDMESMLSKMIKYQKANAGATLPTSTQDKAEHIYNKVDFTSILFMVCLTLGMVLLVSVIVRLTRGRDIPYLFWCSYAVSVVAFAAISFVLALRWIVGGSIPMANGYETMLVLAWAIMLIALSVSPKWRIMLPFGLLLGGFFLLVSHIGQMDPQITPTMPVLRSPLLSVHVSIIMLSYALLSLTFLCSLTAVVVRKHTIEPLMQLGLLMLYPAVATLTMGIFIGAVWANVSWGNYWSWDPKEVWALITLMIYAIPMHTQTVAAMRRPMVYHVFMLVAFAALLMTYFGVNYLMGGMHSYY